MELFAWDERYHTGEVIVDREHRGLFALINRVAELDAAQAEGAALRAVLDELVQYAQTHFHHEEVLMRDVGCDPRFIEVHETVHREFARQVERMLPQNGASIDAEHLLRFLASWLAFHILGIDQSMARQIREIRTGGAAATAYERERLKQADPATTSLLAAMQNLYGMVAERNVALQDFNTKLEAQVALRTRELEAAKQQLESDIKRRELAEKTLVARNQQLEGLNARLAEMGTQLVQAEKLASLGQFAAGVAHEINNPVSFVIANLGAVAEYLDKLQQALGEWERHSAARPPWIEDCYRKLDIEHIRQDAQPLVRESRHGLERVKDIVQELRDFSQVDCAQEWAWSDLNHRLDAALSYFSHALGKIETVKAFSDLPMVHCQPAQIGQVLQSLLGNALEAMPSGGVLRLRSGVDGQKVWLDISDSGVGIAPDILPSIFDPFFTTKPVGTGNGMGLALAYGIVKAHQGRIEVSSVVGQGTCMRVYLPISGALPRPV